MTIDQITKEVNRARPISRRTVARYLSIFGIEPAGRRQRPQNYPPDAPKRILDELGFTIVSLPQLRSVRRKAQKARAGR